MGKNMQAKPLASVSGISIAFLVMERHIGRLIQSNGIEEIHSVVLQAGDSGVAEALKSCFRKLGAAVDTNANTIINSQCYVVSVLKNCKAKILRLLEKEDFSLIMIVVGVVPSYLSEFYVIQLDNQVFNEEEEFWSKEVRKFMDYTCKNPQLVLHELGGFKTSKCYAEYKCRSSLAILFHAVLAVYHTYYREQHCEIDTDDWMEVLKGGIGCIIEQTEGIGCDVIQPIRILINEYIENHPELMFCDIEGIEGQAVKALECGQAILYDDAWYYFPEKLFRSMCEPLRETVSITEIKNRLFNEGYLERNKGDTSGFTVKKVIVNAFGKQLRMRFLKIFREFVVENGSLTLEERGWEECTSDVSRESGGVMSQETLPTIQY